jgi:hypothetical protein
LRNNAALFNRKSRFSVRKALTPFKISRTSLHQSISMFVAAGQTRSKSGHAVSSWSMA